MGARLAGTQNNAKRITQVSYRFARMTNAPKTVTTKRSGGRSGETLALNTASGASHREALPMGQLMLTKRGRR